MRSHFGNIYIYNKYILNKIFRSFQTVSPCSVASLWKADVYFFSFLQVC